MTQAGYDGILEQRPVAGSREHGDELSDRIEDAMCLEQFLENCLYFMQEL